MTVFDKFKEIIIVQLGVNPIDVTMEANIADDLGADSLDEVEIVMVVEKVFNIEIPDNDLIGIKTVGDAVKYIDGRLEPLNNSGG